ncbi:ABC transporter permease [Pseudoglutamicibacter cumminsii]|uniref:ABC transporter permease n=1 Tax=Pseudoglutamicibacter cumminsii TaxID=156979 RepID=UPI0015E82633|nr:ABC transporter permease [Pseudoglutamicibacter cumminsii]
MTDSRNPHATGASATGATAVGTAAIGTDVIERREPITGPTEQGDRSARKVARSGSWYFAEYLFRGMRRYIDVILADSVGTPLMYLVTLGVGLGAILTNNQTSFDGVPYITFIAGALAATMAVGIAMEEMTFPVMGGFKWNRTYYGPQVTPITPQQIARGTVIAVSIRVVAQTVLLLLILAAFGAIHSLSSVLVIVFSTIAALAFGLPCMAFAAGIFQERGQFSVIIRFIFMPMFLFSGTFYPLEHLPIYLQWIGWVSPIWHATELNRWAIYGHEVEPWMFPVHLGVMIVVAVIAFLIAQTRYYRRLRGEKVKTRVWGARAAKKTMASMAPAGTSGEAGDPYAVGYGSRGVGSDGAYEDSAPSAAAAAQAPGAAQAALSRVSKPRRRWLSNLYGRNAKAVMERSWMATKNSTWIVIVTGFAEPVLYLASLGFGLGVVISGVEGPGGQTMSYAAYIAPGLLAVSAMNGALMDTNNMFFKLRYAKLYRVMLNTSLGPMDVAIGEITMAMIRGFIYSLGFYLIAAAAGLVGWGSGLLMIPAAVLIAFGFAAVFMAITTWFTRFQHLDWLNLVVQPLTLFSATFFPLDVYPQAVQAVIASLPLWHGVDLLRMLATSTFTIDILWHVLYFVVMAVAGLTVATMRFKKMFLT